VQISSEGSSKIQLVVTDISGKTIQMKELNIIGGVTSLLIDTDNLAKGTYVLQLLSDGETFNSVRFIK
jgi:hypothetical protein